MGRLITTSLLLLFTQLSSVMSKCDTRLSKFGLPPELFSASSSENGYEAKNVIKPEHAWCPTGYLDPGWGWDKDTFKPQEWLEIDVRRLIKVYGIVSTGSTVKGFSATKYRLQYKVTDEQPWRDAYSTQGHMLLDARGGPEDDHGTSSMLNVFSRKVQQLRIIPLIAKEETSRRICLSLQVYACEDDDQQSNRGLISYSMPAAEDGGLDNLYDGSWDGAAERSIDGLGYLADGYSFHKLPTKMKDVDMYDVGKPHFVIFDKTQVRADHVMLEFQFAAVRNLTSVTIHGAIVPTSNIAMFTRSRVEMSVGGKYYQISQEETKDHNLSEGIQINLANHLAKFVRLHLYFRDSNKMALSEVAFKSEPVTVFVPEETPAPVTTTTPTPLPTATSAEDQKVEGITRRRRTTFRPRPPGDNYRVADNNSAVAPPIKLGSTTPAASGQIFSDEMLAIVIGAVVGFALLLIILVLILCARHRRRKRDRKDFFYKQGPFQTQFSDLRSVLNTSHKNGSAYQSVCTSSTGSGSPPHTNDGAATSLLVTVNPLDSGVGSGSSGFQQDTPLVTRGTLPSIRAPSPPIRLSPHSSQSGGLPPAHPGQSTTGLPGTNGLARQSPRLGSRHGTPSRSSGRMSTTKTPASIGNEASYRSIEGVCGNSTILPLDPELLAGSLEQRFVPDVAAEQVQVVETLAHGQYGQLLLVEIGNNLDFMATNRQSVLAAARRLLPSSPANVKGDFSAEVNMLSQLVDPGLAQVLAVCQDPEGPIVICEYGKYGELHDFLNYQSLASAALSTECRLYISLQLASSLKYLESLSLAHRDIGVRNLLISSNFVIKLSDLALCQEKYSQFYCTVAPGVRLPIRWMAPESLTRSSYSPASDAWMFATTVWELFATPGDLPLAEMSDSHILQHYRSAASANDTMVSTLTPYEPLSMPRDVLNLLNECWSYSERPTFHEIHMFLQRMTIGFSPEMEWRQSVVS